MIKIKIFVGQPAKVENDINNFIVSNKLINIVDIKLSESDGEDGYAITVLLHYIDNSKPLYTEEEIVNKVNSLLETKINKLLEEKEEEVKVQVDNYEYYLDNIFNSLLYADKHKNLYNEYLEFILFCQKNGYTNYTGLLGYWDLKRRGKWELHKKLYFPSKK